MTYMNLNDAISRNISYIQMINQAGNIVKPTPNSVQAAMDDYRNSLSSTDLSVNIVNAPGPDSWPLSGISYITISRDINKTDCELIEELLMWISWSQLNDQAMLTANSFGHVPLSVGWKRRLSDAIGTIYCKGDRVFSSAMLIGVGGAFPAFSTWASEYASSSFKMKYFSDSNTPFSISQMISGA